MSTATLGKRPHAQALADAEAFKALFPPACYERWEFAGSLRRGKPEVADVEHVIIPAFDFLPSSDGLFADTKRTNLLFRHLDILVNADQVKKHIYGATGYHWGDRHRGVDFRGFNHEFYTADETNWGAQLLIRTGPADYSHRFVSILKAGGMYRQGGEGNEGYCVHVQSGERVPVPDEAAYFKVAGIPYVEPQRRA